MSDRRPTSKCTECHLPITQHSGGGWFHNTLPGYMHRAMPGNVRDPLDDASWSTPKDFLNSLDGSSLADCLKRASALGPEVTAAVNLYLGIQTHAKLDTILKELHRMTTQETALVQAVTDLTDAYSANADAVLAEITSIKATISPDTDPVVTDSIAKIETLVATMNTATAAAKAAVAPPATDAPAPTGDGNTAAAATTT